MPQYLLALAGPGFARQYDARTLTTADHARLQASPALAARVQWQTSRALLHRLRNDYPAANLCLSHKNHHALVAIHPQHGKPGADLEQLRPRDFAALAQQTCSADEIAHLAQSATPAHTFYQLWTLKEALIKAEDLRFPTDLRHIGLDPAKQALRSARHADYRWLTLLIDECWIASALWPDCGESCCQLQLYDFPATSIHPLGGNLPLQIITKYPENSNFLPP
ncbi:MAG: 4'-phosphopantetheinyl transferase superfamily protein [Cardiobacteriaceae bacterium]|nr:4'-phosphopantetheinyl transferase superfamily protein [Cardiobacteriaceae bacterium]